MTSSIKNDKSFQLLICTQNLVGVIPDDCMILCYACPECYPQPLDAVCRRGVCVAGEEGCPYTGDDEPLEVEAADVIADPLGCRQHIRDRRTRHRISPERP